MSINIPQLDSQSLHDTLTMLLMNRPCAVSVNAPQDPKPNDRVCEYRRSDGSTGAVITVSFEVAATAAAALSGIPKPLMRESIANGELTETLTSNFYEIANVLGALLNGPGSDHLRLNAVHPAAELPETVAGFLADTNRRVGYDIVIDGTQPGHLTVTLGE